MFICKFRGIKVTIRYRVHNNHVDPYQSLASRLEKKRLEFAISHIDIPPVIDPPFTFSPIWVLCSMNPVISFVWVGAC